MSTDFKKLAEAAMIHCRTLQHVANLHGVEKKQLIKIIDTIDGLDSNTSVDLVMKIINADSAVAELGTEVAAERKSRSL